MRSIKLMFVLALAITLASISYAQQEPIKIGGLFALSGKASHIGTPTKLVAEMIVDKINAEGGIDGRPIELVTGDTESDPSKTVVAAKKLIERGKVVAIVGPTTTGSCMAIIDTIQKAEIPMVACVGGTPPVDPVRKWVFKSPQKTVTAVEKVYVYLKSQGTDKVGLVTASDGFGKEGKASLVKLAKEHGIEVLADETFDPTDVDMTGQLTKIKNTDAQAVICWTIGPAGATVAKNAKNLDMGIPLIQCHGLPDPTYLELAGEAANGSIMPSTTLMVASQLSDENPQKRLLLDFIKEYEDVRKYGKVSTHSGYAWDAIQIVTLAMKEAGTEPDKLRDAIEATKNYIGVSGTYNMSPEDHCGLDVDSLVMIKVEDGKWKLIE
jgi:branched-chain amino acid transport system substrate-binding protein